MVLSYEISVGLVLPHDFTFPDGTLVLDTNQSARLVVQRTSHPCSSLYYGTVRVVRIRCPYETRICSETNCWLAFLKQVSYN
jgi:hypothetical protein